MKYFVTLSFILAICLIAAQDTDPPELTAQYKQTLIDSLADAFNRIYIFPDKGIAISKTLQDDLSSGKFNNMKDPIEVAEKITQCVLQACPDKHLAVFYAPGMVQQIRMEESQSEEQQIAAHNRMLEMERQENFGFKKIEILEGNIGYLRFDSFSMLPEAYATASAAMNFLSNTDAIIIDLRHNGGGSAEMIQFISSYLFPENENTVHLNTFHHRETDTTSQTWTLPHVPGKRNPKANVYILTSDYTFSAAEEFTYNLMNLDRATIVGETTGGGAHPVKFKAIDNWFIAKIPNGRSINPISKTNWEGTGIEPHIQTEADSALDVAYRKAIEKLLVQAEPFARIRYEWALDGLLLKDKNYKLTRKQLKAFAGEYGPRIVRYRDGNLFYQRNEIEYLMVPYKEDCFALEGLDNFRIRFERGSNGEITSLNGLYHGGKRDSSPRTK